MMQYAILLKVAVFLQKQIVDGGTLLYCSTDKWVAHVAGASERNSLVSPLKDSCTILMPTVAVLVSMDS
jgi:hypothetical protein